MYIIMYMCGVVYMHTCDVVGDGMVYIILCGVVCICGVVGDLML